MSEYDKAFPSPLSETVLLHSEFSKAFFAGSVSGTISTILFQPLDVLKTRIQRTEKRTDANNVKYLQLIKCIRERENVFGLWKGLSVSLLRAVPSIGLYFASLEYLKRFVERSEVDALNTLMLGVVARTITCVCVIPITVIKTRVESGGYCYTGVRDAFRVTYAVEGFSGLTAGLLPTIIRDAPYSGLYLVFYKNLKKHVSIIIANDNDETSKIELNSFIKFCCGVISGCCASLITHPVDVIKTKMQLYPKEYDRFLSSLFTVHKKYGFKGFGKGLLPRLFRRTLITAMTWTVYEKISISLKLK